MATEAQRNAVKRSDAKNYFKTVIRFPKDQEAQIRKAASDAGESLNEFIVKAVLNRL